MHKLPQDWKDQVEPRQLAKARERRRDTFGRTIIDRLEIPPPSIVEDELRKKIRRAMTWAREMKLMLHYLDKGLTYTATAKALNEVTQSRFESRKVAGRLGRIRAVWRKCDGEHKIAPTMEPRVDRPDKTRNDARSAACGTGLPSRARRGAPR